MGQIFCNIFSWNSLIDWRNSIRQTKIDLMLFDEDCNMYKNVRRSSAQHLFRNNRIRRTITILVENLRIGLYKITGESFKRNNNVCIELDCVTKLYVERIPYSVITKHWDLVKIYHLLFGSKFEASQFWNVSDSLKHQSCYGCNAMFSYSKHSLHTNTSHQLLFSSEVEQHQRNDNMCS